MYQYRRWLSSTLYHGFVLVLAFIVIYPVLWLVASSFKTQPEIFQSAHSLIPKSLHVENYAIGWRGFGRHTFGVFFRNSFYITILSTLGQVISSALVAYGFSRIRFVGRNFWFTCMILTMLLPGQVLMIPQYVMFNKLGWVNTHKPLIIPAFFGTPFFVFLLMQFIRGIPLELDESAKIDGCGRYGIFLRIILPNLKPPLVTAAIFAFYWKWEDFLGPLIYLQSTRLYPVSLALKLFADPAAVTNWGGMFAMSVLSLVPVFVIFVLFQDHIVEGISTTGLKG
ncbi:MAG: carbohydrate ABC transporter permease [Firmicutes bacterium]|jgi:multiple sugar transport system permease protein|nr:carbohydrate ABC transporter permease [Bacillota bacterium]